MAKRIGIIGAMDAELLGLIAKLECAQSETVCGIKFHTGTLFGKEVVIAKCGIGKVFASMCATAMALTYAPSLIINTGVGGALAEGLRPTDTVVAERLVQHDMDTSALGDPKGLVSGINKIYFESDARAVEILLSAAEALGLVAVSATVATGDRFVADKAEKDAIAKAFGASACEMEGAAVAQAAFVMGIPFVVVRAISDSADGSSPMEYTQFLATAASNSQKLTEQLVMQY